MSRYIPTHLRYYLIDIVQQKNNFLYTLLATYLFEFSSKVYWRTRRVTWTFPSAAFGACESDPWTADVAGTS